MDSLPGLPDLHRHLDGSLRPATVKALASAHGLEIPEPLGFFAGMGLRAALACFDFTLALLQQPEEVRRVAAEICEDAQAEGVTSLEIRFAPQLHRGAPAPEIVDAAIDGVAGRAGLILCGLYGEPPTVLEGHVAVAASRPQVVGIDLAGGPGSGDDWSLADYQTAYQQAREMGLGRTVHAGEGRPAAEIRQAVELLHAQRIGHGVSLLDDPELVAQVCERGITIEACLSSNLQTGAISSLAAHPIAAWLERGVSVCINTDNTLFSRVDAVSEHRLALQLPGMDDVRLAQAIACGHAALFRR